MAFPAMPYGTGLKQSSQVQFGGLNHRKGAIDGEIWDMRNMTSDHYPVLSPREKRKILLEAENIRAVYCHGDTPVYVAGNDLYVGGAAYPLGNADGEVYITAIGERIIVMPYKMLFDMTAKELKPLEASVSGSDVEFPLYGWLYGETAEANSIRIPGVNFADYFSEGDAVTIEGCTKHPENNTTPIIRGIDGDTLSFYENVFTLDIREYRLETASVLYPEESPGTPRYYYFTTSDKTIHRFSPFDSETGEESPPTIGEGEKLVFGPDSTGTWKLSWVDSFDGGGGAYEIPTTTVSAVPEGKSLLSFYEIFKNTTEPGPITISRKVPDMEFIFSCNNRLWGCKGDEIFGSKLGDPFNFNVFDGLSTDSYAVSFGTAGDCTAAINYNGYPLFFKEDGIFKLYGETPLNFSLVDAMTQGVKRGCGKSLAVAGEVLYFVSKNGVMAYTGGVPQYIGEPLGIRIREAVGGSDGRKYYLSADDGNGRRLYVFDTYRSMWHIEDELPAITMDYGAALVCAAEDGKIYALSYGADGGTEEEYVEWMVRFADATISSPNRKAISRLLIRADASGGGKADVFISFDSGEWQNIGTFRNDGKYTIEYPNIPTRCDHFALKLEGKGPVDIYGISYAYYHGSELH